MWSNIPMFSCYYFGKKEIADQSDTKYGAQNIYLLTVHSILEK